MKSNLKVQRCPLQIAHAQAAHAQTQLASPVDLMRTKSRSLTASFTMLTAAATSFALGLTVVLTLGSVVLNTVDPSRLAMKAERPIIVRSIVSHNIAQMTEDVSLASKNKQLQDAGSARTRTSRLKN